MRFTLVPVHCCCTPGLRLGYLQVTPEVVSAGEVALASPMRPIPTLDARFSEIEFTRIRLRTLHLQLKPIELLPCGCGALTVPVCLKTRAFDSAERPIEWWRNVAGFIEDQRRY